MKQYLLFLLCCLSISSFGQTVSDAANPPDYTMQEVTFNSSGIILAGTIYKPKHPFASVVIVHGSGKETRTDKMAALLAKNGIAVLTYDKRGAGKSGGVYVGPEVGTNNIDSENLNLLALDANAASKALLENLPRNHGPLGLMGFSQAGWVIPLAAKNDTKLNFMVLFSGPVVNTLEQLRFQFYTNGNSHFWETHTEAEVLEHVKNDPDRYQFAPTDPRESLAKISTSGLWIFGGKDIQIPVTLSIEHLKELKAQGKSYDYKLFPELGHNTAFGKSQEPIEFAIQWIKDFKDSKKQK